MRQVASAGSRDLLCKREGSDENEGMKAPMYVRALSPAEQAGIAAGLRSSDAFTLRRSQILLASSREQRPVEIARNLGCATQTVRPEREQVATISVWRTIASIKVSHEPLSNVYITRGKKRV
jgi:hypothetical protein